MSDDNAVDGDNGSTVSRRNTLRTVGATSAGIVGLQTGVIGASASSSDEVPIVHTYDIFGEPDTVRMIPKERRRRIKAMGTVAEALENNKWFNGASVKSLSDDPEDLAIEVFFEEEHPINKSKVKNISKGAVEDIPVVASSETTETGKHACGSRGDVYDELSGGISVHYDKDDYQTGTLTAGMFSSDGDALLLTNAHVMKTSETMHQPGEPVNNNKVGSYYRSSSGEDMAAYTAENTTVKTRDVLGVNDLTGTWDFYGIADVVNNNDSIPCTLSGASSCTENNTAVGTRRGGAQVYHEVHMDEQVGKGGDSGGPWVDSDGKLVAVHVGYINDMDVGPAGKQALDSVDAELYYQ